MRICISQKASRSGLATIIVMTVLAIMLVYIMANVRALNTLDKELKLVEQKQLNRLATHNATAIATNTPVAPTQPAHD